MKTYSANLLADVVGVYDKTKTTIAGRVAQKVINTVPVLGSPLSKFIDVFTDSLGTLTPGMMHLTPSGRLFVLMSAPATGVLNTIGCYDFDFATGAATYRGRIAFSISAQTTATARQFRVDDSNTSNIKIFYTCVSTGVLTGGVYMINKVELTDFVPAGFPTIYTAISNDVKGVYSLQDPKAFGGANVLTAPTGVVLPYSSADANINTKAFVHNGLSAAHQYHIFDYSVAPTIQGMTVSTATSGNTTGAAAVFNMVGNTLAVGDPIVITSNAPTPLVLTSAVTAQTVYYVASVNFTPGVSFSVAASAAALGTAINLTNSVTGTTFVRANGLTTDTFFAKTGNLPALLGTLLLTNSEGHSVPGHTSNSGEDCAFFSTSSTMYLGKLTDLWSSQMGTTNGTITVSGLANTSGLVVGQPVFGAGIPNAATIATIIDANSITLSLAATTSTTQSLKFGAVLWPSLINANVIGTSLDYLVPVPVNAAFSSDCDLVIFNIAGTHSLIKKFINSQILGQLGSYGNTYLEAQSHTTDQFSLQSASSLEENKGWLLASCATAPQRGIVAMDLRSDRLVGYSYIITPIMPAVGATLKEVGTVEQLFDTTASVYLQYRTGSSTSDSVFNTATTGWTTIATAADLSSVPNSGYVQFRIMSAMVSAPGSNVPSITTPPQISDLLLSTQPLTEVSDNWDYSFEHSSSGIPTRVAFKLRLPYTSTVPTLHYRAYDESDALLVHHNSVTNAVLFEYSTNNGSSWLPLGSIPNTAGTLVRYTYTTPPGVNIRVSVRES